MTTTAGRRVSIFHHSIGAMKIIPLGDHSPYNVREVLPWVEEYTKGTFYLSSFSIGFEDEYDLFMFKLAFKA